MKARKRPIESEVHQVTPDNYEFLHVWTEGNFENFRTQYGEPMGLTLFTVEGIMKVEMGSWICKGVEHEFWAIKDSIFQKTYEIIEE